ncbi:hypothetical protein [Pedosphaera parvula]|uniref:Uncharacterized protein n=1 Tax=Pedosphaera parvula (strain Ellin514) TaxID=320771 RepID=B9XBF3_PEDPL|nr:hypothetical protein [Pedosphaera parvula]EEF62838.1 hypothetical protein Cflav_PD5473 [Pedosphaera parvula Ellin514]
MKTETCLPKRAEFYRRQPENHILVQNNKDDVLIRATHDNFSDQRKAAFIRELAAEGFIPDHYQWFSDPDASNYLGIRWVVDSSWLQINNQIARKGEMLCGRALMVAAVLWVILVALVLMSVG